MCGLVVIAAAGGRTVSVDPATLVRMRDRLAHRGPDAATEWINGSFAAGHRRLAIMDPRGGAQPWVEPEAEWGDELVLTYNGELYEHQSMRAFLPGPWTGTGDTETLARCLQAKGPAAIDSLRGMYAFAAWWPQRKRLVLARDPLGIKPLYWTIVQTPRGREVVAASEIPAILDHPSVSANPDWSTASAYLSTIRVTCGERTMYRDINVLPAGHRLIVDLSGNDPVVHRELDTRLDLIWPQADAAEPIDVEQVDAAVRFAVRESVAAHLESDVPVGSMLSGGIDSSIIAREISERGRPLHTWCAAGPIETSGDGSDAAGESAASDDPVHAAALAGELGFTHSTIRVNRRMFAARWPELVGQLGVPLGTPNEVAINAIAAHARTSVPVLLSGEGADELFAGYLPATTHIFDACGPAIHGTGAAPDAAALLLQLTSWIPSRLKSRVLQPDVMEAAEHDAALWDAARSLTNDAGDPAHPRSHLTSLARRNLSGLLARLDSSTMLASVEGRTPLADANVAQLAASIPLSALVSGGDWAALLASGDTANAHSGAGQDANLAVADGPATIAPPRLGSKQVLRRGWRGLLPDSIVERPKESFPLPFGDWLADQTHRLGTCPISRGVFTAEAIQAVTEDPVGQKMAAWPMINLAMWLQRWA
ncbi:MAG: asparagine synthase (glutamine-hydrolyzing) [Phycisphaerales bacterium]